MKFAELINIGELQELCESFTALTGAVIAILDLEGNILIATGWQDICTRYHRVHPVTALRCRESDTALATCLREAETYNVYRCKNGLVDVAVPITIGGEHVANLYTGQFLFEPPDRNLFIRQAEEFGFDKNAYLEALDRVAILSENQVKTVMSFLSRLARLIAGMGLVGIKNEEKNAQLRLEITKRSKTEEALRNSERKYRAIFDQTFQFIGLIDTNGILLEANEASLAFSGISAAEVIGKPFWEGPWWQHSNQLQIKLREAVYKAAGNEFVRYEATCIRDDGSLHYIDFSLKPVKDESGRLTYLIAEGRDITERKQAEEELRQKEEALRSSTKLLSLAAELAHLGSWEYNPEKDLFEFGDKFYTIYGTDVAREGCFMSSDTYAREFVHPDEAWIVAAEIEKALNSWKSCYSSRFEHRIIRRDGEVRTIVVWLKTIRNTDGKIIRIYGANQDITEHKAMEEALRSSREKLSLAVEIARLGPWEYNPETNLFEFGEEFYAVYGTNVAREGRFMSPKVYAREFVHPDDAWIVEAEVNGALSSTVNYTRQVEHRIIRRDGEVRTIIVRINHIRDATGKIIKAYGVIQDITEQKAIEENLRISREKLSLAAELAHLGPWEYNLDENVFEFGDEFYAIYGTDEAREGRFMTPEVYAREFVHPDEAWIVDARINRGLSSTGSGINQSEHRIIRRDGEVRMIVVKSIIIRDTAGKVMRWFGANQDITEQKAMEEDLRISREKLSLAVELARLGPWELNIETHCFEFNDEFYTIYGTSVAREGRFMIGDKYVREFVHPDDVWMLEAEKDRTLSSREQYFSSQLQHRIIRRDGQVRTVIVRVNVIRDDAGKIIRWFGVNQDITEQVQAEEAIIAAKEARARAEKLFSLGMLSAGISHEINQPLNFIKMVASGISYTYQTGKKRDIKEIIPQIEEINRQTDRINNIIGQLRSLMRRGEIRAEPCDINEVVEQSLCLLKHRLVAHGINVKTCLTKGLPRFLATLTALEEIIINLLVNAMQALDTIDRPDKEIVLKTHFDGGVVLLVSDNGPGINADVGEKIFEPFISDRPGEDNLGLGLAIVNSLVASYGGTIGYESGEETGTVFIVKFPAGEK